MTSRPGSGNGRGLKRNTSATLKTAVLQPIPRPSVRITNAVKPGLRVRLRKIGRTAGIRPSSNVHLQRGAILHAADLWQVLAEFELPSAGCSMVGLCRSRTGKSDLQTDRAHQVQGIAPFHDTPAQAVVEMQFAVLE